MKNAFLVALSIIATIDLLAAYLIISGEFTITSHEYYLCALIAAVILALDLFMLAKGYNTRLVKIILWGVLIISFCTLFLCNGVHSTAIMLGIH